MTQRLDYGKPFVLVPLFALRGSGRAVSFHLSLVGAVSFSSGIWPLFAVIMPGVHR